MKVLHIYKDYYPVEGGIENHVRQLAEAQGARGHQVSVLVASLSRHTHTESMNGVRVIFAGRWSTISSTPIAPDFFRVLAHERPDIIHLQFPYPWGEAANYMSGHARRTVITYQSDIVRQRYLRVVYAPLMQRVLAKVDRIIATSPNYVASSPVLGRWVAKCTPIPMGIDPQPFSCVDEQARKKVKAQLGIAEQVPVLLSVGVLRYYKGLQYMLQAMPQLPDVHWLIVGTGPMEQEWRRLASSLGVQARVHFIGEVTNSLLSPYYAASDVFVFPSSERSEAFGLVQLEAMAAGKPIISTELGTGTSYVNVNGETGLVVPARDSHALAGAVGRLLGDAELRRRMGAAARVRVCSEFTINRMVDSVLQVYEEELARR